MLYELIDLQRASLAPWTAWLKCLGEGPAGGVFGAWGDVLDRTLAAGEPVERPLREALGLEGVESERLFATPFVRVDRLRRGGRAGPAQLLVAPHSGYAASALAPVAAAMLAVGDVIVTDWADARTVPAAAGPFGFAEQTELVLRAIRAAHPVESVVAVSQGGIAALRALAALARTEASLLPRRVALLGTPVDPRLSPTLLQSSLTSVPEPSLAGQLLLEVPAGHAGAGRRVMPAFLQLMAIIGSDPCAYLEVQGGFFLERLGLLRAGYGRQHRDVHALSDVPGELFLDLCRFLALRDGAELKAQLGLGRSPAGPTGRMALLTVEAGQDALVGRGQTHAAAELLGRERVVPVQVDIEGAAHHELITGPRFAREVAPVLRHFLGTTR
jgi:poly(3-hydroxybutyrate) depolymerase